MKKERNLDDVAEVVNEHSKAIKKLSENIKDLKHSIDYCKAAIEGIKAKDNSLHEEGFFKDMFK